MSIKKRKILRFNKKVNRKRKTFGIITSLGKILKRGIGTKSKKWYYKNDKSLKWKRDKKIRITKLLKK